MLLVDKKISTARDIVGVLEAAIRGGYPLMIMAEDIEQEALATLVVNKLRGRCAQLGSIGPEPSCRLGPSCARALPVSGCMPPALSSPDPCCLSCNPPEARTTPLYGLQGLLGLGSDIVARYPGWRPEHCSRARGPAASVHICPRWPASRPHLVLTACACCSLKVVAIKAPGFGERKSSYLEDIATLTGGQVVKDEVGLQVDKVRSISYSA